ncbi:Pentachlorophenol 4-monooxygenase [Actinomadura rubteroloni]|uniref:Pentachlorophenol 4-monooxygenase n=1 Tax=Actinomadura rubteroloni TaxID=1926885 RepID=A0A2P4UFB7_9ACTN|nr:FAD-dependent monooxygenase [Actinomadura rubteroloni]POM23760.1 Pentachlorophenol 4-monooxygenase [Actinomadura rubteroloni]
MDAPVIVVGAGPTGLVLAAELRLGGVDVIVLERLPERSTRSRGLGYTARVVEMFDQRGLLPRFGSIETSARGHFGGIPLDYSVLEDCHFGARGIPQTQVEQVLEAWAVEAGADIRRGTEVVGLRDDGGTVEVTADTPQGRTVLRARYVVGCDGGRSTVRNLADFDATGSDATMEMYLADVVGAGVRARQIGERLPGGMVMSAPLGDGVDRIIVCEHGTPPARGDRSPSFDEVADAWKRLTGESLHTATATWVSAFGDATRQVTRYRKGNVLLAGDAAHTHLPAGGQGLSVSAQDAFNLGWKLAAVAAGRAPDELLDTYHDERHPVGTRLLANTRAQGLIYLGGSEVEPLRAVFEELMRIPDVARHLAGMVSGLDIRYDVGAGDHPLLGRRIPPRKLTTPDGLLTTAEVLHDATAVLLDLADDAALRAEAAPWTGGRLRIVTAAPHDLAPGDPLASGDALLVRPDGYVAWTGADPIPLSSALDRWLGRPTEK